MAREIFAFTDWDEWAEVVTLAGPPTTLAYIDWHIPLYSEVEEESETEEYYDLESQEIEFIIGSREEFDVLMGLFLMTEPDLDKQDTSSAVVVNSGYTERYKAHLKSNYAYTSPRLLKLANLLFKYHYPHGWNCDFYSDNNSALNIVYPLKEYQERPARQKMEARRKLREWLISIGENPVKFGLEDWEKVV